METFCSGLMHTPKLEKVKLDSLPGRRCYLWKGNLNSTIEYLFKGKAAKVMITKDSTLNVTDRSTQEVVQKRVISIQRLFEVYLTSFIYAMLNNLLLPRSLLHHKLQHYLNPGVLYYFKFLNTSGEETKSKNSKVITGINYNSSGKQKSYQS